VEGKVGVLVRFRGASFSRFSEKCGGIKGLEYRAVQSNAVGGKWMGEVVGRRNPQVEARCC
jgi:hypothetical protein